MAALTVQKKVKNATYYREGLIRYENCRGSYPHLLKAFAGTNDRGEEGVAKFGIVGMLEKEEHAEAIELTEKVIAKIFKDNDTKVARDKLFMRDGDDMDRPEYENHFIISARESKRPTIRDVHGNLLDPVDDKEQIEELFYGGAYFHILVRPWYQDGQKTGKGFGKRINAGLVGVMLCAKKGEAFGDGRIDDADAWSDMADEDAPKPASKKKTPAKSDLDEDEDDEF